MSMARVEQIPDLSASAVSARRARPLGKLTNSLLGKLFLLLLVFVTVPVILYSEFRQADAEKRRLLLESARAQGRLVAESLRPLLEREDLSPLTELKEAIAPFATDHAGIKVLYRPANQAAPEDFFFVAAEPPAPTAKLDRERDELIQRGVIDHLAESCAIDVPIALRHRDEAGEEELLTSITPVNTVNGCWAIITSHTSSEMLGTAIDQPYWKTIEVRVAAAIYFGMAVFTFGLFYSIWRGLMRFRHLARRIGQGRAETVRFAAQNEVPELTIVAEEFDRMTDVLRDSADSLRRAAEDNAHAFKTPIAIMRQSLEPLDRLVPSESRRGRRALEVLEESIDRLDYLVASARRLDQATAELLDSPREKVNFSRLLERMVAAYGSSFARHSLTVGGAIQPELVVRASEDMLETVLENLIDNAMEVSPPAGEMVIDLIRDGVWAQLSVRDRGPGVRSEDLDRIFERYVSLRPKTKDAEGASPLGSSHGGGHMGIGLWIVRRNVQALGGSVWAENRSGGGLAVIMRLPVADQR